jgi:hypothetical protein
MLLRKVVEEGSGGVAMNSLGDYKIFVGTDHVTVLCSIMPDPTGFI